MKIWNVELNANFGLVLFWKIQFMVPVYFQQDVQKGILSIQNFSEVSKTENSTMVASSEARG